MEGIIGEKTQEEEDRQARELQDRQDAEAQDRAVKEFELVQAGFDAKQGQARDAGSRPAALERQDSSGASRGEKRKFELDEDELLRIAQEDRAKARKAIDEEKDKKEVLPSFWTPSVVPVSNKKDTLHDIKKKTKQAPVCPASQEDKPHHYALHDLISINFSEEEDPKSKMPVRTCPACNKALSNASKAMMAKPCGHVLCKSCVNKFMKPTHDPHSLGSDVVRCYARIVAALGFSRSRVLDRLIAATAIIGDLVLVTSNGPDFDAIPGLKLEVWPTPAQ